MTEFKMEFLEDVDMAYGFLCTYSGLRLFFFGRGCSVFSVVSTLGFLVS